MSLTVDSNIAYINSKKTTLDVAAKIINGRTLVPVRFIAESLGAEVEWNSSESTVEIYKIENTEGIPGIASLVTAENPSTSISVSSEVQLIAYNDYELGVILPGNTVQKNTTITITSQTPTGFDESIIKPIACYDVTIKGQNTFSKDLAIMFPIDYNELDDRYNFEDQIIAGYFNEATQMWQVLPYEEDTEYNVVSISTNHLTSFMVGSIKDASFIDAVKKHGTNSPSALQNIFEKAKESVYSFGGAVKDKLDDIIMDVKLKYEIYKGAINILYGTEIISVYSTNHFQIAYSSKEEAEATLNGYTYSKRQFDDSAYEKIVYGKNFVELFADIEASEANCLSRYPGKTLDQIVPIRIKEMGIFLEEAYQNMKAYRPIETPYVVYVAKGGNPRDNKFSNSMYIPLSLLTTLAVLKLP